MSVTVSIAMTTYNGAAYLREQLDSLYAQTHKPDEIIVVDDCSSDETSDILEEYHRNHGLIYYRNEVNLGINLNFSKALSLCQGRYVAICDQDDVWFPEKIERLLEKMQSVDNQQPTLVVADLILVDENLTVLRRFHPKKYASSWPLAVLGNVRQGCCMFMNRPLLDLVLPIPDSGALRNIYDFYIAIIATMCGDKHYLSMPLMCYRVHGRNAVGHSLAPLTNPLAVWARGKTQTIYEFPLHSRFDILQEINRLKRESFLAERRKDFDQILAICAEKSIAVRTVKLFVSRKFTSREKWAVFVNSILYSMLFNLKKIVKKYKS